MKSSKIRVQKAIADRGIASRRQAEELIKEGRVAVNGNTVQLGDKCDPINDQIEIDGAILPRQNPKRIVLGLNKPTGFICSNYDPHSNRTVFDLLPPDYAEEKLFCVGRLDKDSEGLLIITNDGDLNQKLTHPTYRVLKKYIVSLNRPFEIKDTNKMVNGITWEGDRLKVEKVVPLKAKGKSDRNTIEIHMQHGKKREIRRLLYAIGYDVKKLKRVQIGAFPLKGIPKGRFHVLNRKDVELLLETNV